MRWYLLIKKKMYYTSFRLSTFVRRSFSNISMLMGFSGWKQSSPIKFNSNWQFKEKHSLDQQVVSFKYKCVWTLVIIQSDLTLCLPTFSTGNPSSWLNFSNSWVQVSTFAWRVAFISSSSLTISWSKFRKWNKTDLVLSSLWSSCKPISLQMFWRVCIAFCKHGIISDFIICTLSSTEDVDNCLLVFLCELLV